MSQARPPSETGGREPRSRSGFFGRRSERTGSEPVTARSALGLRLLITIVALPLFVAGAVLFAWWAVSSGQTDAPGSSSLAGLAVVCGLLAVFAALDLVVILRRRSRERGPG